MAMAHRAEEISARFGSGRGKLADVGAPRRSRKHVVNRYLRERGVSCREAFYLLGRAREATGAHMQAAEFYRRALYLEPNHYETLLRWAALALKCGDHVHAGILRSRAGRVQNRR